MTEQRRKVTNSGTNVKRLTTLWRQRFFNQEENHCRSQNRRYGQDPEDVMPAQPHQHPTADNRCHQRCNSGHQHDKRHHPRELFFRVNIAHQGINDHAGRSRSQPVEETHHNQLIDGVCQRTRHRGGGKHQRTAKNHRLTPEAVCHRPVD